MKLLNGGCINNADAHVQKAKTKKCTTPAEPTRVSGSKVCLAYTATEMSVCSEVGCSNVKVSLQEGERVSVVFKDVFWWRPPKDT